MAAPLTGTPSMKSIPAGARPFADFARPSARHGFAVVSDQTISLPPLDRAPRSTVARAMSTGRRGRRWRPAPTGLRDFDALFDAFFREETGARCGLRKRARRTDARRSEAAPAALEPLAGESAQRIGGGRQRSGGALREDVCAGRSGRSAAKRLARSLADLAPRRRGFRHEPGKARRQARSPPQPVRPGPKAAAASPGRRRREKLRRVLLLIDISGSMKAHTDDYLRFAHVLTQSLPAVETFSFGTRLTRLTKALRHKDVERALGEIAPAVADWSGGTRIGESLAAFLADPALLPRLARSAGRWCSPTGSSAAMSALMASAVRRLAARSWRLAWLTPLAADPAFAPATAGLKAVLPFLDHLGDGSADCGALRLCRGERGLGVICRRQPDEAGSFMETPIIDAHHHIWRQGDLPWLDGPMLPRIFGPYEPIRRDYPMAEYLADIAERRRREVGLCPGQLAAGEGRGRSRLGGERRRRDRLAARDRRLCRPHGRRRAAGGRAPGALSAAARHPHAAALAREPAIPLRQAARPRRRTRPSARISPWSPTTA